MAVLTGSLQCQTLIQRASTSLPACRCQGPQMSPWSQEVLRTDGAAATVPEDLTGLLAPGLLDSESSWLPTETALASSLCVRLSCAVRP